MLRNELMMREEEYHAPLGETRDLLVLRVDEIVDVGSETFKDLGQVAVEWMALWQ